MTTIRKLIEQFLIDNIYKKSKNFTVLGIGSSLRDNSKSTEILQMTLDELKNNYSKVSTKIIDLRKIQLPIFDPNKPRQITEEIEKVTEDVNSADAFILASPDYHGSMSGGLKNLLDYFWREFSGKLFGYIVASHEKGLTVMEQMRTSIRQCYGWSLPYGISIHAEQDFDQNNLLINQTAKKRISMMAHDIFYYGTLIRSQYLYDLETREPRTYTPQR